VGVGDVVVEDGDVCAFGYRGPVRHIKSNILIVVENRYCRPRGHDRRLALRSRLTNERPLGKGLSMDEPKPPCPPFDVESAHAKTQAAEDAWNTRDPHRVSLAYTEDSVWRNRDLFITGREEIVAFLTSKWDKELDYVLRKSLWGFRENRIAVRFQYEWHDGSGQWYRSYGNELWEFADNGLMRRREASINDVAINEAERRYFVDAGFAAPH